MEWAQWLSIDAAIIKIDIKMACDKAKWHFILAMWKAPTFRPFFLQVVKALFVETSACLSINKSKS